MRRAVLINTAAMSDDEALAWLKARGEIRTSIRRLARSWRWPKSTVWLALQKWADEGHITVHGQNGSHTLIRWNKRTPVEQPNLFSKPRVELTCKTCRWWCPNVARAGLGECRRYPPQPLPEPGGWGRISPTTGAHFWCGEHEEARHADTA